MLYMYDPLNSAGDIDLRVSGSTISFVHSRHAEGISITELEPADLILPTGPRSITRVVAFNSPTCNDACFNMSFYAPNTVNAPIIVSDMLAPDTPLESRSVAAWKDVMPSSELFSFLTSLADVRLCSLCTCSSMLIQGVRSHHRHRTESYM